MEDKKIENLKDIFSRGLNDVFLDIKNEDVAEAVSCLIERANIKNFSEFVRIYKYRHQSSVLEAKSSVYAHLYYKKFKYKQIGELLGHSGQIDRVCFDNSSEFFFTASTDGMIKMWNTKTGFLVHSFIAHRSLVNDLCFSKDGRLMVSCDFFGTLNIWSLETKEVLNSFQFHIGVDFTEFFACEEIEGVYNLVVILSTGILRTYKFNTTEIIEIQENDIHANEMVKAICITDGGRFLLRGGYWPYLIVLDTTRPKECIIFDTDGLSVHTLCASKDCLQFAAACANYLYQWSFQVDGSPSHGNFHKSNTDLRGYWLKTITQVDPQESFNIERMCYLKDNYIVCVCSDFKIRIYAGTILKGLIDVEEQGVVCPHPSENVFALCGSTIKFYYIETKRNFSIKLVESIEINFNVTDCQFSNDGYYFIIGDDFGKARVFSLVGQSYSLSEQFFLSDFNHINSLNENVNMACDRSKTVDTNRNTNEAWQKTEYAISFTSNRSNSITEDLAFKHLERNFIDKEKYIKKYGMLFVPEANTVEEESEVSSISDSVEFSDAEYDESESESEEKGLGIVLRRTLNEEPVRKFQRRRIVLEESSSEERRPLIKKLRRNRSSTSEESSSEENLGRRRRNVVGFLRRHYT
ncbi:Lissencephaly-1 like protein [Nosema granulosis]|uniref:Lissencephaly-1 like protein n=1 Tax=Nosema granulosis TaxID=83296 RepID=A0A9P6GZW2_9MICR|nr:Lissencephaly-1 like protein [Nosema granulosis]